MSRFMFLLAQEDDRVRHLEISKLSASRNSLEILRWAVEVSIEGLFAAFSMDFAFLGFTSCSSAKRMVGRLV